jgi:hypothetical protein
MKMDKKLDELLNIGAEEDATKGCDDSRASFTFRGEVITHPEFCRAVREIARRHKRRKVAKAVEGMLLVAQTGCGKSTVLEYYENCFPRQVVDGVTSIPVLRVSTPESPTVKSLAESILMALGDPLSDKGTTPNKTHRIVHLLKECCVEVLMIDEFQHFQDGHRKSELSRVSDWLKNLTEAVKIPLILCGLPRAISVLYSNPQLRRRFGAPHYMEPFSMDSKAKIKQLRGVLNVIQLALPCPCIEISNSDMASRFYYATHGLMDYIVKIVDDAVSRGGSGLDGLITQEDFAEAFRRCIWFGAPDDLNPFVENSVLRLLNKPMEPFDVWDGIDKYTLRKPKSVNESKAAKS